MPSAGDRLGDYRLEGQLGRGGMGEVWLAADAQGTRVALKLLLPRDDEGDDVGARFEREVELLTQLDHPGIVRALSPVTRDGLHRFYAMELVLGRTLAALLRAGGPLEPGHAIPLVVQLLEALGAAHAAGVIHRDVKPSNVLVDRDGRARLADFGLAIGQDLTRLTAPAAIVGTLAYLSPEQCRGQAATPRSDLYATGALLFELLAGAPPFAAEHPAALLHAHQHDPAPDLGARVAGLPAGLAAVVATALAKDPAARHPSAAAFRDALRDVSPLPRPQAEAASTVELRSRVASVERSQDTLSVERRTDTPSVERRTDTPSVERSDDTLPVAPAPPARRRTAALSALVVIGLLSLAAWRASLAPTPAASTDVASQPDSQGASDTPQPSVSPAEEASHPTSSPGVPVASPATDSPTATPAQPVTSPLADPAASPAADPASPPADPASSPAADPPSTPADPLGAALGAPVRLTLRDGTRLDVQLISYDGRARQLTCFDADGRVCTIPRAELTALEHLDPDVGAGGGDRPR